MVCVDTKVTDVVAGYDRIVAGEQQVVRRSVSQRVAVGTPTQVVQPPPAAQSRPTALVILGAAAAIGLAALAALAALFLVPVWLGPDDPARLAAAYSLIIVGLIAFSALAVMVAVIIWLWLMWQPARPSASTVAAPPPPRAATVAARPEALRPRWRAAMSVRLPPPRTVVRPGDPQTEDYPGVYEFITRLAALPVSDPFPPYILCRLRPNRRDDLDAVVVDRRGVWLFEVRYWPGHVAWRSGRWEHVAVDRETGMETRVSHSVWPDERWQWLAGEMQLILKQNAPGLMTRYPRLGDIQGGIVLAHPDAQLSISSGIPIFTGRIDDWLGFYPSTRGLVSLDERAALEVVEALLARHNEVVGQEAGAPVARRSMLAAANRLIG